MRRLLFLGLALCVAAHAATPLRIELAAAPAWKGWSRPGAATEVDLRVGTDAATRVSVDLVTGRQTVHAALDLEPGRVTRLQLPLSATGQATVSVAAADGTTRRLEIDLARSESPLLAVGLAADEPVALEGFHGIVITADDLPRNASAYEAIDALILDAPTLRALDPRQLAALLAHAAACGRIAVVGADDRLREALAGTGGCGGRTLMTAASATEATRLLSASLASSLPPTMTQADAGALAQPGHAVWNAVALTLAAAFAAGALALVFTTAWPALVLTPALAAVLALALLHALQPRSQLVVWSEGESGARAARYQAWQRVAGVARTSIRMPIPTPLAASVRPCEPAQPIRFEFDAGRAQAVSVAFDARLFGQVSLCYAGGFPLARELVVEARADGSRTVANVGARAWPQGLLLADRRVHELPPLAPGAGTTIGSGTGTPPRDAVTRTALARMPVDGAAALWDLELAGVADASIESNGWLLVTAAQP